MPEHLARAPCTTSKRDVLMKHRLGALEPKCWASQVSARLKRQVGTECDLCLAQLNQLKCTNKNPPPDPALKPYFSSSLLRRHFRSKLPSSAPVTFICSFLHRCDLRPQLPPPTQLWNPTSAASSTILSFPTFFYSCRLLLFSFPYLSLYIFFIF